MRAVKIILATALLFIAARAFAVVTYDGATGVVNIPSVKVGNELYTNVTLQHLGNYRFRLTGASGPTALTPSFDATYDVATGILSIPTVLVGSTTYIDVTLRNEGSFTFQLTGATEKAGPGAGSGTFAQAFASSKFYKIDEATGNLFAQADSCQGYRAADVQRDGTVVAVSRDSTIDEIDVVTGVCRTIFATPTPMRAIAVSPAGNFVTIDDEPLFGALHVYQFSPSGSLISKARISGTGGFFSPLSKPEAIDFGPDGTLYATELGKIWELDPLTGEGKFRAFPFNIGPGDIDIDSSGVLRSISFGVLYKYSVQDWKLVSSRVLERDYFAFSPLVHR